MRFGPAIRVIAALFLAVFGSAACAGGSENARYLGSFPWDVDKPWFGGWSGIEVSADGTRMSAITDRGYYLRAGITRDNDQITAITPDRAWRLKASTGKYLTPKITDSEGLAEAPDGTVHISFEGITRVAQYARPSLSARTLRHHRPFTAFSWNKSLEALAMDQQGRLFAIPERLEDGTRIRVFVLQDQIWSSPFTLDGGNGFLPVGADFDDQGRFYLLERAWSVFGFRARVRRWELADDQPTREDLLVQTSTGTHDNLEGLAVWRDDQGRTRLTMIADDNFLWLQSTEIVEYAVQE